MRRETLGMPLLFPGRRDCVGRSTDRCRAGAGPSKEPGAAFGVLVSPPPPQDAMISSLPITMPQAFAFGILLVMMAMFAWGKLRYDLVALAGLLAAVLAGIVPYDKAFSGFSEDIVIIVASALLVSAAVARSGVIERAIRPISPYLTRTGAQVAVLTATVTVLSAFVKNIGALAMMMPVAFQLARRNNKPVSALLMPMAFGSLLGGIVTLIGTSPNIIVSRVREEVTGQPFGMFDFTPVGVGLAVAGVIFLSFGYRLLPRGRKGQVSMDAAFNLEGYTTEAVVPEDSAIIDKTVGDLKTMSEDEIEVLMLLRSRNRRYGPADDMTLQGRRCPAAGRRSRRAGARGRRGEAQARARRRQGGERHAARRHRRHGSGDHRQLQDDRPHAATVAAASALPGQPAGVEPARRARHAPDALGQAEGRRRAGSAGQSHHHAGGAG